VSDQLAKISKLLRKAETTNNEAEAEAFLQAAQRLSTLYSIDLAKARAHTAEKERRQTPIQRVITIGDAGKKGLGTYADLFMKIGEANNVKFNVAGNSTAVFAFGFAEDIDLTEAIYASVLSQMVRESDAYIRKAEYKNETVWRVGTHHTSWGTYRDWGEFPVSGRTARINFQEAFARRVYQRLLEAKQAAETEAIDADALEAEQAFLDGQEASGCTSAALAIRATEVEVKEFYKATSTARGTWRGSQAGSRSRGAASAGDAAGRRANLGSRAAIGTGQRALA